MRIALMRLLCSCAAPATPRATGPLGSMAGPRPLVLCGPSGSGKSTLLRRLMDEFGEAFGFSVSHTTRGPRPGEKDGKHYHFVSRDVMEEAISDNQFIESAEFSGNLYGTSKAAVDAVRRSGRICVLDIDIQGVQQMKETDLQPRLVFVKPPDFRALEDRLRARGTETEDTLKRRLSVAQKEVDYGEAPGNFDVVIVNDDLDKAYQNLREFIFPDIQELQKGIKDNLNDSGED